MEKRKLLRMAGVLVVLVLIAGSGRWQDAGTRRPAAADLSPPAQAAAPNAAPVPVPELPPAKMPAAAPNVAGAISARLNFASAWQRETQPVLAAFDAWAEHWLAAPPAERAALVAKGAALARARRAVLKDLIKSDPRQALASAVPMTVRAQLPPEVLAQLEERVSGEGRLALIGGTPAPGETLAEPVFRTATVGEKSYRAFIYGRREAQATKVDISLSGVALDGEMAVSDSPLRVLEPGETPAPGQPVDALCPISGDRTTVAADAPLNAGEARAVEVGGCIYQLCHVEHVPLFENRLINAEDAAGPYPGALTAALTAENGQAGTSGVSGRPPLAWSTGTKKVLLIRVDFSDKTGTPVNASDSQAITQAYAANVFNVANGITDFYAQASYGQTALSISSADVTAVYRMPHTASYYAVGNGTSAYDDTLHTDARTLATAGGFNLATYDRIGVVFSNLSAIASSKITYSGLGDIQGNRFWLNGSCDFRTAAHEIGHNYGLQHANLWQVADGNPVSASGTSTEYGDPFGVMSSGSTDIRFHFDMWEKSILHWIPDTSVTTISAAGTYRVYRFDHASANTANALALKIVRNASQDYWIGLRKLFTSNASLNNGAYILWGYNNVVQGNLLDFTTPGTDPQDAALGIGTSFYDSVAGITITPLARGGTSPNEYLDVRVNFGPFTGNVAPTVTIGGASTLAARQTSIFTAQAADADGDALSYAWDFGQGAVFDNNPSAAFSWISGGTYTVKVTVSDMKGHSAQATKTVTVTDPITTWTARTNSSTGDFNALVASPTKVLAVGEDYTAFKGPVATSTDGITWTATQLGSNQHVFAGVWDGAQFLLAGQDYNSGWVGCVFTSPTANAGTWTRRIYTGSVLHGIAYGGGVYVAVGENGIIRRSTDGINWPTVTSGTVNRLVSVAYGGGKFVAVGYASAGSGTCTVLTSANGSVWTDTSAGSGVASWQDLRGIIWTGDRFISCGWYSKLCYSLDLGATFATTRTRTEDTPALAYGNGVWFAAGVDRDNGNADIDLISTDGANWTALTTPSLDDRKAAIFFNNTFITAGVNHSIRQSGTITLAVPGYYAWRESYFPDHGPLSTYNTDADGDGLGNLLEYGSGTDPTLANGGVISYSGAAITQRGLPTTWVQNITNGVDYRALFGRRKDYVAVGLTYTVQFSGDMVTWENSVTTPTVLASDAEIDAVTVPYPFFVNGRKARFFRVQVSLP